MKISDSRSRRFTAAAALLAVSLAAGQIACKRHRVAVETVEESPVLASVVATADPHAAAQLITGFYGIEQNSWRWTAGRFSVLLRPPHSAATAGAVLQLKFAIPDVAMSKYHGVSLSAYVNGTALAPESYTQAGQFTFTRDVPASLLSGDSVRVDFAVDKTMPPTPSDKRELGVVVSMIGFQPK
ncbi:MAG TPA: hypothetical protein VMU80_06885 [Bryobacteraceae bacterium]|nr:hypothetical protein [Bryobacteraceae bacterium]